MEDYKTPEWYYQAGASFKNKWNKCFTQNFMREAKVIEAAVKQRALALEGDNLRMFINGWRS